MPLTSLNPDPEPAPFVGTPANDNHKPDGRHEWPAGNRLRGGRLMRTPEANLAGLIAMVRLRGDVNAADPQEQWVAGSDSASIMEDVSSGYGDDLDIEFATAEHVLALHMAGKLGYREAQPGLTVACKRGTNRVYLLDDRSRGEKGPAKPTNPDHVRDEINGRYAGAAWPKAPGSPMTARELFIGSTIKTKAAPRTWKANDEGVVAAMFAKRTLAYVRGAMPSGLWSILESAANGSTAEEIGEDRGHAGKYASAVGTELQRLAIEALIEAYAEFDGCHLESVSQPL